ncbi:unnamed protein product [Darwinula stevensoni]|uniref:Uncharacterized protein n=1 Tax=Darwinula stevensoni TaxID=69355 RepID=A0A7R9AAJ8_9CRUS|nr:unnamed protein product [Darwinula stevensoni]CAG0898532.1 unnamed protein product [Darwinula stevensoni]
MSDGIYLFIGFSQKEEELVYKKTKLTADDVLQALNKYLHPNEECFLRVINKLEENIVMQIHDSGESPVLSMECRDAVLRLRDRINSGDAELLSEPALSIVKLSEVASGNRQSSGASMSSMRHGCLPKFLLVVHIAVLSIALQDFVSRRFRDR